MAVVVHEDSQEAEVDGFLTLDGLAEMWESSLVIRKRARKMSSLLEWPSTETVGIPSMNLERTNEAFISFMVKSVKSEKLYE